MITAADLEQRLPPPAAAWLAAARRQPLAEVFPATARTVGREPLAPLAPGLEGASPLGEGFAHWSDDGRTPGAGVEHTDGPAAGWTTDQAVRALLLVGVPMPEVASVYRFGDAAEKLAVLKALPVLDLGDAALPILEDAIRTNDQRLLAAALGAYATKWLPQAAFRQAVLKCVFAGVPLAAVDGLPERVDDELVRMMKDFAAERTAAGRVIPDDLVPYLNNTV